MLNGFYRLVIAQSVAGGEREVIDLYFEEMVDALPNSRIIVAGESLDPTSPLVEGADPA